MSAGPLAGLRVVELAGIGPAPFAAMVLADLGADVVRIDRPPRGTRPAGAFDRAAAGTDHLGRGRRRLAVDLKHPAAAPLLRTLLAGADILVEGFRPGVMERLGLGPEPCLERNPRLVYCRITGWGQDGPLARAAGHDIGFTAVAGALGLVGRAGEPPPPTSGLVGDFGGGALLAVVGILSALHERAGSGRGQVVDAAIVDGVALLTAFSRSLHASGALGPRGTNLGDGGDPLYAAYETADGRHLALGAIEPRFRAELLALLGLEEGPGLRDRVAAVLRTRTRDQWAAVLEGTDACAAPVLDLDEAPAHPHLAARSTFVEVGGEVHVAPAPRFDRTPAPVPARSTGPGADTVVLLQELGLDEAEIARLVREGVVAEAPG